MAGRFLGIGLVGLAILSVLGSGRAGAWERASWSIPRANVGAIAEQRGMEAPVSKLEGDILAVDDMRGRLTLGTPQGALAIEVPRAVPIFREGRPVSLGALRPVAPQFYQRGAIWLDARGQIVAIEAGYPLFEAEVVSVDAGRGELVVALANVPDAVRRFEVRADGGAALAGFAPGSTCLLFLDLDGRLLRVWQGS